MIHDDFEKLDREAITAGAAVIFILLVLLGWLCR